MLLSLLVLPSKLNPVLRSLNWNRQPSWFIPCGLAAMIALTILVLLSIRPVRQNAYEFFFITHFFMIG